MKLIQVRTPYYIEVDESGQLATKIELYIYQIGSSVPASPTYTLKKNNPSATQTKNVYNIAPFIKDFIKAVAPITIAPYDIEFDFMGVLVQVKTYYDTVGDGVTYTLADTLNFVATNGYNNYSGGANQNTEDNVIYLIDSTTTIYTNDGAITYFGANLKYFNVIVDWDRFGDSETCFIRYRNLALS